MRLTVVGSGCAAPNVDRAAPGHWVEAGTVRLLMDCGHGLLTRMCAVGLPWGDVTHVALTHFHYDHVGELPALLVALRWGQAPARSAPLTLIGPVGTRAWMDRLAAVHGTSILEPGFPFQIAELAAGDVLAMGDGVDLAGHPVPHTGESMAYCVTRGAARLVYTGDTELDTAFAAWASGCTLLLAECSLPEALAVTGHLTPDRVGQLAARVQPAQLVLTHLYPSVLLEDIVGQVGARWSGPCTVAHDGSTFELQE
jgi:ribonuclease BN (tRNA processing enzyme)